MDHPLSGVGLSACDKVGYIHVNAVAVSANITHAASGNFRCRWQGEGECQLGILTERVGKAFAVLHGRASRVGAVLRYFGAFVNKVCPQRGTTSTGNFGSPIYQGIMPGLTLMVLVGHTYTML